ncbi:MAG: HDOD domain-containing protein [Thermoguttaceae bacterium]
MPIEIDPDFRKRVRGASLLALPQSAARVVSLSQDPENGPAEYAKVIGADLGLSSQVLRFVNSSFFGFRHQIKTVQHAMTLVHVKTIKNFVLWNAIFATLPDPKIGQFSLRAMSQDSLRRGVFAKLVAAQIGNPQVDPEETFLCALLQDISLPIIAQLWVSEYRAAFPHRMESGQRLSEIEREIFLWDHALAGGYFAGEWGLGEEVAEIIAAHTALPTDNMKTPVAIKKNIVSLSALLPPVVEDTWREAPLFFDGAANLTDRYPHVMSDMEHFLAQVDVDVADLYELLRFSPPTISLAQAYVSTYSSGGA